MRCIRPAYGDDVRDHRTALHDAAGDGLRHRGRFYVLWKALDAELSPMRKDQNTIIFGIYGDFLQNFAASCAEMVTERFPHVSVKFFCDGSYEV